MAECYQKLGDVKSKEIYERIVREYSDQPQALREAQKRLVELDAGGKAADTHVVTRQIWIGDDVNVEGRPSADGKLLTYIDYGSTSTGNVAIRDLTTGKNKRLTNAALAEGYAYSPVISPDSRHVAYAWFGEGTSSIRMVGVDGGQPREIARMNQSLSALRWSADGRTLGASLQDFGDHTWRIVLVQVSDGSIRTLKSTEWREPVISEFSPDGRFLLYAIPKVVSTAENGIYAISVDGSSESALARGTADDSGPVWTADGRAVVFLSDRTGTQDLWSVAVADGKPQGEPVLVRSNVGNIVTMGFARDGSYFYGTRNATRDVYVAAINPDTLEVISTPRRLSDEFVGSNMGPAWSPDGRSIVFVRGANRLKRTIVLLIHDGWQ